MLSIYEAQGAPAESREECRGTLAGGPYPITGSWVVALVSFFCSRGAILLFGI